MGDVDRIKNVANRVKATRDAGHEDVVVVSARAGVTNELIAKAKAVCALPSEREMDQLLAIGEQETIALTAMAIHELGEKAEQVAQTELTKAVSVCDRRGGSRPKCLETGWLKTIL